MIETSHFFVRGLAILCLPLVLFGDRAYSQYYVSELRAVSPAGAQPGTALDMTATVGTHLEEIDSLYFSHPGITAKLKTLDPLPHHDQRRPQFGHFTVTVAADVPPGRYEVRAGGRHGISNPRAFLVSGLDNEVVASVSHDIKTPTAFASGNMLHAKSTAAEIDYYALHLDEGQTLQVELFAQQVDSRMIGQLKLFDPDGRIVLAERGADDVDPSFLIQGYPAGDYVLAVHDFTYRGGDEYHYQLVVRPADAPSLIANEGALGGRLPERWAPRSHAMQAYTPPVATSEPSQSQAIDVPSESSWWFPTDRRDVVFEFPADKGATFAIDVVSQRIGQPTDARMIVHRIEPQQSGEPKLHQVSNTDDSFSISDGAVGVLTKDPSVMFTAPETAQYRATIRDLDAGRMLGDQQTFAFRIKPPEPGFDLIAFGIKSHPDINQSGPLGSKLFRAGAEVIRVLAIRRDGWGGPIKISVEGLPDGVTASEGVIGANQNRVQITLVVQEDAAAAVAPIRIVGRSEDDKIKVEATPVAVTWSKGGGRDFVRSRIASSLYVAVSDKDLSPLSITLGDGKPIDVKKGTSVKLPIKLVRRDGGKAQCVLKPRDLPPGVTADNVTIPADKNDGEIEFKVAAGAANGTYSLWMHGETKMKLKPNPQALQRAQAYRAHLQTLHDDPAQAANLEAIKAAITEADKMVDAANKGPAKEQELAVHIPTSNATIRVLDP